MYVCVYVYIYLFIYTSLSDPFYCPPSGSFFLDPSPFFSVT